MNHSDIQARMADYLDGELSLDSRALFDAHLDQCEPCSHELAEIRDTIRLLRTLPNPEPPVDLVSNVMQRIADGEGQPDWLGRVLDRLSRWVVPNIAIPVTAVAAALILTVITGDLNLGTLDFRRASTGPALASNPRTVTPDVPQNQASPSALPLAPGSRQPRVLAADQVQLAETLPRLRLDSETGAGPFLFRVAIDQRGPIQLRPGQGDAAGNMFRVSNPTVAGPFRQAFAAPSFTVTPGGFGLGTTVARQNFGSGRDRGITPVAVSRITPVPSGGEEGLSLEGRRLRELDARLRMLQEDPPGFAHQMATVSVAEQEIWLRELAARAEEIGDVERVMSALQGSGDEEALRLARDFELAVKRNRESWAAAEAPAISD